MMVSDTKNYMDKFSIKDYLKHNLKLERRHDINGNTFICLILEDEIIGKIQEEDIND